MNLIRALLLPLIVAIPLVSQKSFAMEKKRKEKVLSQITSFLPIGLSEYERQLDIFAGWKRNDSPKSYFLRLWELYNEQKKSMKNDLEKRTHIFLIIYTITTCTSTYALDKDKINVSVYAGVDKYRNKATSQFATNHRIENIYLLAERFKMMNLPQLESMIRKIILELDYFRIEVIPLAFWIKSYYSLESIHQFTEQDLLDLFSLEFLPAAKIEKLDDKAAPLMVEKLKNDPSFKYLLNWMFHARIEYLKVMMPFTMSSFAS